LLPGLLAERAGEVVHITLRPELLYFFRQGRGGQEKEQEAGDASKNPPGALAERSLRLLQRFHVTIATRTWGLTNRSSARIGG
jgi:hypothetical protein